MADEEMEYLWSYGSVEAVQVAATKQLEALGLEVPREELDLTIQVAF